jgi:hypothetical protein
MTFYKASMAEEEDRKWRRGRGDNAEDGAVDVRSGPFAVAHARPTGLLQRQLSKERN